MFAESYTEIWDKWTYGHSFIKYAQLFQPAKEIEIFVRIILGKIAFVSGLGAKHMSEGF